MRWGRLARRLAIGLAAGLVLLVLIVLATLATGFGQRLVLAMALPAAGSALGTAITVEETGGAWPGRIRLSGITLADEAGVFATIGRLELDWTARALLGDHVDIDRLAIAEVDLRRLPATQEDTEAPERPFALPDLPRIDVGALLLSDLRLGEAIVEGGGRIDARGSARLAGRRLEIALDAEPEGSPEEHARIHLLFAGRRAPVTADIDISAPPGGLIARLAGLPEGARLTLRGTGPAEDFGARIAGRLGGIATASGTLRCACAGPIDARLALTLASGPDAPESLASLLGEGTEIGLRLAREGEDLVLVLDAAGTGQGGG
ncbi:MAG: hypothetical protein HXY25_04615, partial [Alphaproteobacteria bacterium]|nr:hypothetical protein [Alphaproteobacteria bacterium]